MAIFLDEEATPQKEKYFLIMHDFAFFSCLNSIGIEFVFLLLVN
jgi:hypothetical protein